MSDPRKSVRWFSLKEFVAGFLTYLAFSVLLELLVGQDIELKRHLQCLGGLAALAVVAGVQHYQIQKLRVEIEKLKRAE